MWGVGQMAVIYLAKLQDVPAELYEAAEIDGAAGGPRPATSPSRMISPVILFNVVMAIIGDVPGLRRAVHHDRGRAGG